METNESLDCRVEEWFEEKDGFYDTSDIPSWELLAQAGDFFKDILRRHDNARNPSLDLIKDLIAAALMLSENADSKQFAVKTFAFALTDLEDLAAEYPELAQRLTSAASALMIGSQFVIAGNAAERHKSFAKRVEPLIKANAPKTAAVERAQAIATELWQADTDQEFRLSDMAEQVKDILEREGFDKLPKIERIKDWIRPVAPEHARQPGRR